MFGKMIRTELLGMDRQCLGDAGGSITGFLDTLGNCCLWDFEREPSRSRAFALPRKGMMKKSSKTPKDSQQGHEGIEFNSLNLSPWSMTENNSMHPNMYEEYKHEQLHSLLISHEVHPKGLLDPARVNLFVPVATRRIQILSKEPQHWIGDILGVVPLSQ